MNLFFSLSLSFPPSSSSRRLNGTQPGRTGWNYQFTIFRFFRYAFHFNSYYKRTVPACTVTFLSGQFKIRFSLLLLMRISVNILSRGYSKSFLKSQVKIRITFVSHLFRHRIGIQFIFQQQRFCQFHPFTDDVLPD